ncbi:MAG: type II secretion system F family protein [Chloroflexi bacterium]|nr:type II secretion system F family protein [Chloroflexota bacterium]
MINASILGLALLAAFGVFLVTTGVGAFGDIRLPRVGAGVSLEDETARIEGESDQSRGQSSLLDRALAPVVTELLRHTKSTDREWLECALDLLNYPSYLKTPADYYAAKVLFALGGFVAGSVIGVALTADGIVLGLLLLPPVLGLLGFYAPGLHVTSLLKQRREEMLFEIPYVLDRLNVCYAAERSLSQGLIAMTSVPEGGFLMREFRQVTEDYLKNTRLQEALQRMATRNADVPLIERIAERLAMTEETGADSMKAMQVIGARAGEMVENMISERGEQNNTLMIVPTLIALIGIFIAVAGPSLASIGRIF